MLILKSMPFGFVCKQAKVVTIWGHNSQEKFENIGQNIAFQCFSTFQVASCNYCTMFQSTDCYICIECGLWCTSDLKYSVHQISPGA